MASSAAQRAAELLDPDAALSLDERVAKYLKQLVTADDDLVALDYPGGQGYYIDAIKPTTTLPAGTQTDNLLDKWKGAYGFIRMAQVQSNDALVSATLTVGSRIPSSGRFSQTGLIQSLFNYGQFNPDPSGGFYCTRYDPTGGYFAMAVSPAPPGIPFSGAKTQLKFYVQNTDVVSAVINATVVAYVDARTVPD